MPVDIRNDNQLYYGLLRTKNLNAGVDSHLLSLKNKILKDLLKENKQINYKWCIQNKNSNHNKFMFCFKK